MSLNTASLLDLKAELLKKSAEIKNIKLQKASAVNEKRGLHKKTSLFSKKNKGVLDRAQKDFEEKIEEDDAITQSRIKLEAKSRLYEKIAESKGVSEHDGSKGFLVDFEQKSIRRVSDKREQERLQREAREREEDLAALEEDVPEGSDPSEQWVDYVDSLGRSRRCLRKDLPELQHMDRRLRTRKTSADSSDDDATELTPATTLYREQVRRKWEEEARRDMTDPDGPLHYANVQFDEVRTHGVGFYQFNKDEAARQEQLDALKELRQQTKEQREQKAKLKAKRKAMMKARLAKVKQRKLVREGKEATGDVDVSESSSEEEHMIGPQLGERYKGEGRESPELLTRDESLRKDAPIREWDKDKKNDTYNEEKWLDGRREERDNDFAPPQSYYDDVAAFSRATSYVPSEKSEFVPPSLFKHKKAAAKKKKDYAFFTDLPEEPVNPMAFLEQQIENESESSATAARPTETESKSAVVEFNVSAELSAIRREAESKAVNSTVISDTCDTVNNAVNTLHVEYQSSTLSHTETADHVARMGNPPHMYTIPPPPAPPIVTPGFPTPHAGILAAPVLQTQSSYAYDPHMPPPAYDHLALHDLAHGHAQFAGADLHAAANNATVTSASMSAPTSAPTSAAPAATSTSTGHEKKQYASAPVKYDKFTAPPTQARYERVNLYDVPDTLPAPPTSANLPVYPSQEEVFGTKQKSEKDLQRQWSQQFRNQNKPQPNAAIGKASNAKTDTKSMTSSVDRLKPQNIPFVSPYVQKQQHDDDGGKSDAVEFDPSKPPPTSSTEEKTSVNTV